MARAARQLAIGLVVLIGVLLLGTGVASAHATVVSSTPADGSSVATSPAEVTITFSESITASAGGLSVLDSSGTRVVDGTSRVVDGRTLSAQIPKELSPGTYVMTYRVLSADGHPVSGSSIFAVGSGAVDSSLRVGNASDRPWQILGGVSRAVMYLAALLAAGMAFFLAFIHDRAEDRWRLVPVVRIGSIVALFGAIGIVMSQAALLTGDGAGAITQTSVLREVLTENLGWSLVVLMIGLAAVHLSTDIANEPTSHAFALYGGLAVTASFAVWGHARELTPRVVSIAADLIHATAAALWLGGLVGLAMVLSRRDADSIDATAGIIGRFSRLAFWSVLALTVAGLALTITGSDADLHALVTTTWGRLVLAKIGLAAIVIGLAAWNRRSLVPSLINTDATDADDRRARWRRLLRSVRIEVVILVIVVCLTAILVNVPPARNAVAGPTGRVAVTKAVDTGSVALVVDPAAAGTNTVEIRYTDPGGRPVDVASSATIEFSQSSAGLAPITRRVPSSEPGVFVITGNELSIPGTWTIAVAVRTGDFTEQRTSFDVPIRN